MVAPEQVVVIGAQGLNLHLPTPIARDLACRVADAANALPKRGLEVSGLLLGEHLGEDFLVKSLFPIPCRYADGPAFRATENELRDAAQKAQALGNVVGIYRSRNDGTLESDQQDRLLIEVLACPTLLVLLFRQQKNTAGEGRLLLWDGQDPAAGLTGVGEVFPCRQLMPFASPMANQSALFRPVAASRRQPPPLPEPQFARTEGDQKQVSVTKKSDVRIAWTSAVLAVLLAFFLGRYYRESAPIPAPQPSPEVVEPRAPLVIVASPSELAGQPAPQPVETAKTTGDPVAEPETAEEEPKESSAAPAPRQPARLFRLPWIRTSAPRLKELPLPAPIEAAPSLSALPVPPLPLGIAPKEPGRLLRPRPSKAVAAPTAAAPRLVLQTRAVVIPPELRGLLRRETVISLRVQVNAKGRVSKIFQPQSLSNLEHSLWDCHADAVKHWVFEPAQQDGKATTSETTLQFRLSPGVRR